MSMLNKILWIILFVLVVLVALSIVCFDITEGAEPLRINVFQGVDQSKDLLDLEPGQASGGYDYNLGQTKGSMVGREGFVFLDATDTLNDRTGIFGYIGMNGERRLFATVQSDAAWDYVV